MGPSRRSSSQRLLSYFTVPHNRATEALFSVLTAQALDIRPEALIAFTRRGPSVFTGATCRIGSEGRVMGGMGSRAALLGSSVLLRCSGSHPRCDVTTVLPYCPSSSPPSASPDWSGRKVQKSKSPNRQPSTDRQEPAGELRVDGLGWVHRYLGMYEEQLCRLGAHPAQSGTTSSLGKLCPMTLGTRGRMMVKAHCLEVEDSPVRSTGPHRDMNTYRSGGTSFQHRPGVIA